MKKFRVLHLIRPAAGGMKRHLLSLLGRLDQDFFEIIVCCPGGPLAEEIRRSGWRVFTLPLKGELSFAHDLITICRLAGILQNERITILHAHSAKAGLVGRLAAYLSRTPLIFLTAHNSILDNRPAWERFIFSAVERSLNRVTDRVIAVSEALRRELIRKEGLPADKVTTIYNGIDPGCVPSPGERRKALCRLGLPFGKGKLVGTVARLAPQKGVTYFLRAAAMLVKDYPVNFLIVGDGPLRRQLQKEAASLGLENRVLFTGERDDVPVILAALDVFVLPSLTEGFPFTILEALAAARPVVATRVGGVPEIITDNLTGLLVEPGDPAALALAIARLLGDREKALSLGRLGQERIREKFTDRQMVQRVEEEYRRALIAKGLLY